MSKLPSSSGLDLSQFLQLQHLPKDRDDLLRQIAKRLNDQFDLVKIVFYLADVPSEVYPLQLLPCPVRTICPNLFVYDGTSSTQLVSVGGPNVLFAPLYCEGHRFGVLFLEMAAAPPRELDIQGWHALTSHIARALYYLEPHQSHGKDNLRPPALIFDDRFQQVWIEGQAVHLSTKESVLLRYLYDHAGQPCPRRDLVKMVYGEEVGDMMPFDRRLDKLVTRLRTKLKRFAQGRLSLETVRSVGYQLQW